MLLAHSTFCRQLHCDKEVMAVLHDVRLQSLPLPLNCTPSMLSTENILAQEKTILVAHCKTKVVNFHQSGELCNTFNLESPLFILRVV